MSPGMAPSTLAASTAAFFLASTLFSHDVALRLVLLALTLVTSTLVMLRGPHRESLRILPAIWLPFVLWGAWAALSLAWSIDPALTRKEWQNEVLYCGFALFACHLAAQARATERIFLGVGGAAVLALCLSAFVDFWGGANLGSEGWHGGPGNLSGLLLIAVPCAGILGWYALNTRRPLVGVAAIVVTGVGVLASYTTLNRTVWIAFTVQALVAGGLVLFRRSAKRNARALRIAGVGAALVIVTGVAMAALTHEERIATTNLPPLRNDPRIELWSVAAPLAMDHPLTGYGFGRGMLHEPLLRATGNEMLWHSHNFFIDAAIQTGFPGLLLLLLLLASTAAAGWRFARSMDDRSVACGAALIAVVIGMAIRNMTDLVTLRHVALAYWGVAGVLMAWGAQGGARAGNTIRSG